MRFFKRLKELEGRILLLEHQYRQDQQDLVRTLAKIDSRLWILEAARDVRDRKIGSDFL